MYIYSYMTIYDPVRACIFETGSLELKSFPCARRVGRPRLAWSTHVHQHCLMAAGSLAHLESFLRSDVNHLYWRQRVNSYVKAL